MNPRPTSFTSSLSVRCPLVANFDRGARRTSAGDGHARAFLWARDIAPTTSPPPYPRSDVTQSTHNARSTSARQVSAYVWGTGISKSESRLTVASVPPPDASNRHSGDLNACSTKPYPHDMDSTATKRFVDPAHTLTSRYPPCEAPTHRAIPDTTKRHTEPALAFSATGVRGSTCSPSTRCERDGDAG